MATVSLDDVRIEAFIAGNWVDLTPDCLDEATWKYGIDGNTPEDCTASPGALAFTLDNSENNSAQTLGYYSPRHANKRSGWAFGIPVRVVLDYGSDVVKFYGKIQTIDPDPGEALQRKVRVVANDGIFDLLEAKVREIDVQLDQDEAQLIDAVLDAIPSAAQPLARSLDDGVNILPVAFDDLQGGTSALTLIQALTVSIVIAHIL